MSPSAWKSAPSSRRPRPITCVARSPSRATSSSFWAGAPAAMASAARPGRRRRTTWKASSIAVPRCRRATPLSSASFKGCSAAARPAVSSNAATTSARAACRLPWARSLTACVSTSIRSRRNTTALTALSSLSRRARSAWLAPLPPPTWKNFSDTPRRRTSRPR